VKLHLHQGSPKQVADMLMSGEVDVGIATEALNDYPELVALPCYRWTHSVIVPPGHALLDGPLTLESLARFPLITYDTGLTGRSHIDGAFTQRGLAPNIVLTAMDADVIKTYVQLNMGVGIVASIAYEAERDTALRALDAGRAFRHQPDQARGAPRQLSARLCLCVYRVVRAHAEPCRGRENLERRAGQRELRHLEPLTNPAKRFWPAGAAVRLCRPQGARPLEGEKALRAASVR
jgi:hypothetical protein